MKLHKVNPMTTVRPCVACCIHAPTHTRYPRHHTVTTTHGELAAPCMEGIRVVKVWFSLVLSNNFVNPKPNLPFSSQVFLNLELNHMFSLKDVQFRFSEV